MTKSPAEALPKVTAYYDMNRKCYWIEDRRAEWIEITETSLKRHFKASGLNTDCARGEVVSELEQGLNDCQMDHAVSFAGPLAGYRKGMIEVCGQRILVTSEPKLIQPAPGQWSVLEQLLNNLFTDSVHDQLPYVKGWLKVAVEAQRANIIRPGQALAMAGPRNCGKSLLQNVITEILGGRSAKPYRYMSGATPFNSELFGAEHLMIEDEFASHDPRSRRAFGAKIKDFTVNELQSCHAKGRQAISLRPFWRLTISLNDEPENLAILPPLDESLLDKIILLRVRHADMPMPTETPEQRTAFWSALVSELPAFVHHLMEWAIPQDLRDDRFGVASWLHPELMAAIDDLSPEIRLQNLIDAVIFADASATSAPVILTAEEVEHRLLASSWKDEARKLFSFNSACGTYLGRLAPKSNGRVESSRTGGQRRWVLKPPLA